MICGTLFITIHLDYSEIYIIIHSYSADLGVPLLSLVIKGENLLTKPQKNCLRRPTLVIVSLQLITLRLDLCSKL